MTSRDQEDRLVLMAQGDGKWDLSENDTQAIGAVLFEASRLRKENAAMREALENMHDDCCLTKFGKLQKHGPFWAPTEASVKQARKALERKP